MPLFEFKAYDKNASEVSGAIDADDCSAARRLIKARGLAPFEIKVSSDCPISGRKKNTLSLTEQARFSRQMAALLKGGVTLTKALSGIEGQLAWAHKKSLIISLRESIEKGADLSSALEERGNLFSPTLLSIIKIGENTGKLDFAFARIASHLEKETEQRRRFIAAIAYPAITALISVAVLAFLMVYLVPVIARMFSDVEGQLPLITRLIISFSGFFSQNWLVFILFFSIVFILFRTSLKIKAFKLFVERLEKKIPIWGAFIEGMKMESWARNMGIMLQCGVNLLDSVKVLKGGEDSISQHEALSSVEEALEKGGSFSDALKLSGFFPAFLVQMVEAGESSGELYTMLESAANELESENRVITELFLNTLEPLLIVIMGVVVGTIMIGVLLPIYEMNKFI